MKKIKVLLILLIAFTFTTVLKAETQLPAPEITVTGEYDQELEVYTSEVTITLSVDHGSASIEYKLFEGAPPAQWSRYSEPMPIQQRGNYRIIYRSVLGDNIGVQQSLNIRVRIPQSEDYPNVIRNNTIINHKGTSDPIILPQYEEKTAEVRGVWVSTVSNIDITKHISDEQYKNEIITILNNIQKQNMNTVFFQVRPMNDAFYPSELAPFSEYIKGAQGQGVGWDVLQFVIDEAHKRGLELHAWMNPYRVANIPENSPATKSEVIANLDDKNFAKKHPEYTLMQTGGKTLILDPGQPAVRQYLYDVIEELMENYDVDGIHFDDYFYVPTNEDAQTFGQYNPDNLSLHDWRRSNVDKLVEEVNNLVQNFNAANNKKLKFGISPVAIWKNGGTDGSNTSGYQSYVSLYADTRKWVINEWLDYMLPQVYFDFSRTAAPFATIVDWWVDVIETHNVDVDLIIGLGFYRYTDNTPWENENIIPEQLRYINQYDVVKGSVVFSYRTFNRNIPQVIKTIERLNDYYWLNPVDFPWESDVEIVPLDDEETLGLKDDLIALINEVNSYIENNEIKADTDLTGEDLLINNYYTKEENLSKINNDLTAAGNIAEVRVSKETIIEATNLLQSQFNDFKETVYEGSFDPNRQASVNTLQREIDIITDLRALIKSSQNLPASELPLGEYFAKPEYLDAVDQELIAAINIIADESSLSIEIDQVYRDLKAAESDLRANYFQGENPDATTPEEKVTITFEDGNESFTQETVVDTVIEKPFTPYKAGKLFKGWYLDEVKYEFDEEVAEELTLVAKWEDLNSLEKVSIFNKTKVIKDKNHLVYEAIINEKYIDNEHGFYLVYGRVTEENFLRAINNNSSINDKKVFKVEVTGVTEENSYSVILTGIPERGFDDVITAIPYMIEDGELVISDEFHLSSLNHALELQTLSFIKNEEVLYLKERKNRF